MWHPDPNALKCGRWPENLWLVNDWGEMVRGRCKSPNRCGYCATIASLEISEMLAIDATEGVAPQLWMVLGTRTATIDVVGFYRARELVQRAIRRRWPEAQFAWIVEWTTGYGSRSGGLRRPHWNCMVKLVPQGCLEELADIARRIWCSHVDGQPARQYVGEISAVGGLMRYLALHFQKSSQAPPEGFRGKRFTCTAGYFPSGQADMRSRAQAALLEKRVVHGVLRDGLSGLDAEVEAQARLRRSAERQWKLTHGWPTATATHLTPTRVTP